MLGLIKLVIVRFAGDTGIIILCLLTEFHSTFGEKVKIQKNQGREFGQTNKQTNKQP